MDHRVERGLAKWPDVPAVFGWLALDRRGNWLLKNPASGVLERIGNAALNAFISRNYACDASGRWYFQNGPQRVYVALAYAPLVARLEAGALRDHCGVPIEAGAAEFLDEEGSVLIAAARGLALLDDRDLAGWAALAGSRADTLPRVVREELPARFGFNPEPGAT